jgi:hypothetical protein
MQEKGQDKPQSSTANDTSSTEEACSHHLPYEHSGENLVVNVFSGLGEISFRFIQRVK